MEKVKKVREVEIDYAYGVIDAVVEAMDKVAAKPELAEMFVVDMLKKMPDLIDAIMIITREEHRPKMGELMKASSRMVASWVSQARI